MKQKILVIFLVFSTILYSQEIKSENLTETVSTIAEFPGGDNAYRNELYKMIHGYIDLSSYAANGTFTFSFDIDTNGKTKNLKVTSKVKNSELFIEDMLFCMKKLKLNGNPLQKTEHQLFQNIF